MRAETCQRPGKEAAGSRHEPGVARQAVTAAAEPIGPPPEALLEEGLRKENLLAAWTRVQAHQGAPSVDGMTGDELPDYLRKA
jgi:RNA-directed DNA polymerase